MDFNKWMEMNPRTNLLKDEFKEFFEYAKKRYSRYDQVNWTSFDDEVEQIELIQEYLGDSMEAILLFKEWLNAENKTQGDSK